MNRPILRKHIQICKKCFKYKNNDYFYVKYYKNLINKLDKVLYHCNDGSFTLKQNLDKVDEKFEGDHTIFGYLINNPENVTKKMNESIDILVHKTCPYYLEHEMIDLN